MNRSQSYEQSRNIIMGIKNPKFFYGTYHFKGLEAECVRELIESDLLSRESQFNDSPTVGEILDFAVKWNSDFEKVTFFGFIKRDWMCIEALPETILAKNF